MLLKICSVVFFLLHVYSAKCCTITSAIGVRRRFCAGDIIFQDEFDHYNPRKWKKENTLSGGGNWEFQWYTDDGRNSYVHNGLLYLRPTLTADKIGEQGLSSQTVDLGNTCTDSRFFGCKREGTQTNYINPIRSAKLTTIDSFAFKYGRVEVRAKVPTGDWLWPAIWFLPKNNEYGGWPMSGEIDLMESRGNEHLSQNNRNIGTEQVGQTLHWGPEPSKNQWWRTHFEKNSPHRKFNHDFHTYGLEWTPNKLVFTIDGERIGTVDPGSSFWNFGQFGNGNNPWSNGGKMAPFDKEFYIILNLAVGGTNGYFPDNAYNPSPKPWSNQSPQAPKDFWLAKDQWLPTWEIHTDKPTFQIDYVRVYAI